MEFITPKNWKTFQHYKNRSPPWIKLHRAMLDDYDFCCLPIASKALAPLLWLLASDHPEGQITCDAEKLAHRLRWDLSDVLVGLSALIDKGFFCCASDVLATCLQSARAEGERERETEGENTRAPAEQKRQPDGCPHADIVSLYHEILPTAARVKIWNDKRQTMLRQRWREDPKRQTLDYWRRLFGYIAESDFLMGRVASKNRTPFSVTLAWIVGSENFAKIVEGSYHNKATP